jgi:hypothetical protein
MTFPSSIIFPDSSIPEKALKELSTIFGSVKVCRPWFMEKPTLPLQGGAVQVLYPPERLKPAGDFQKLLAEYRGWSRTSQEKGFDAFLAFKDQALHGEEATWEIRAELRRKEEQAQEKQRRNALKWNLLLHLAYEIQEEGKEAEDLLKALKGKGSPLKGVIEEEDVPGPLSDLPEGESSPLVSEAGLSQVLEAWFSLFEEHLSGDDVLLTLSPEVFQFLCGSWEEWGRGPAQESGLGEAVVLRKFPHLAGSSAHPIVRHLSGKTLALFREEAAYGK